MKYVAILFAAFTLVLGAQRLGRADAPPGVQKWEYKFLELTPLDKKPHGEAEADLVVALDKLGGDGWEFAAVYKSDALLKRPVKIDKAVADWVAAHTAEEVVALAEKIPIPASIAFDQAEVVKDPQVIARQCLTDVSFPGGAGTMPVTNVPLQLSATPASVERSFPGVGTLRTISAGGCRAAVSATASAISMLAA